MDQFPERMEGDGVTIASHVGSAGIFRGSKAGRMKAGPVFRLLYIGKIKLIPDSFNQCDKQSGFITNNCQMDQQSITKE